MNARKYTYRTRDEAERAVKEFSIIVTCQTTIIDAMIRNALRHFDVNFTYPDERVEVWRISYVPIFNSSKIAALIRDQSGRFYNCVDLGEWGESCRIEAENFKPDQNGYIFNNGMYEAAKEIRRQLEKLTRLLRILLTSTGAALNHILLSYCTEMLFWTT